MPNIVLHPPLVPREGQILRMLEIDRISTKNQNVKANDDQLARNRRWIQDRFDGSVDWTRITGQGSGECLDRAEVVEAEEKIATGKFDGVIMEDLGRHLRRIQAVVLCELCEDKDTRLIAINDGIDPGTDWRLHAFFAAIRHEQYNKDTSERIKRTLRNRFANGEALERRIYGYVDPPDGASHDSERQRDPAAETVYKEWFRQLERGATYTEIADWLNRQGVATGPYSRKQEWDGKMVWRVTHNHILKGLRRHNLRQTKRVNSTGKYVSKEAPPQDLQTRECPHLAFFEAEYFDRITQIAKVNNSKFKPGKNGVDPRRGRPKKKTVWPGQHIYCGTCGRLYRYGGHGQNHRLLCRGAYEYRCWNSITVNGPIAAVKLSQAVMKEIVALREFDSSFRMKLENEVKDLHNVHAKRMSEIERDLVTIDRQLDNTAAAISDFGPRPKLRQQLDSLEAKQVNLWQERRELEELPQRQVIVPTAAKIRDLTSEAFRDLAVGSDEFSRLIRSLISRIVVYPVRLVDGGHLELRARFLLNLVPLVPDAKHIHGVEQVLRLWLRVDLFDPPQREEFRASVMIEKAKNAGGRKRLDQHQIAAKLGITHTAVQRAVALQRKMDRLGVTDAYQVVTEPPEDYTKLRRHKHPRYRFEPLPFVELF